MSPGSRTELIYQSIKIGRPLCREYIRVLRLQLTVHPRMIRHQLFGL
ncbi:hypothetical protein SAMN05660880_01692 [Luteibacter sp. 22Crub2.1]|nr:hypothetical protein SAMN04515659_2288 [Dyella sp. 333MFSha]SKB57102.1 hypothetical protein SAMN05660880_01692 [Luteibacter sp. 22Crub2.1]